MSDARIRLEAARDLDYVERVLEANDLPVGDVRSKPDCFYVGYDGENRVGIGGLKRYGEEGLLRSLVVQEAWRGEGYGTAICEALERRAHADGVERLWLLTTTAADFFARRGYEEVDRNAAPQSIQNTTEFANLCPASATCLLLSLPR